MMILEAVGLDEAKQKLLGMQIRLRTGQRSMMDRTGQIANNALRQNAPRSTTRTSGTHFADSITYRVLSAGEGVVESTHIVPPDKQKLAEWIIDGTPPHTIRAKNKKLLRFYSAKAGRIVYKVQVNHPGTKANPFNKRTAEQIKPQLAVLNAAVLAEAINGY